MSKNSSSPLAELLHQHLQAYLQLRRAEGLRPSTLAGDERCLRRLFAWLAAQRGELDALARIDRQVLADYALHLATCEDEDGHRLKVSTRHNYLCGVAGFFRWLKRTGRVLHDPTRDLPYPKLPVKLPRGTLTEKELRRVLKAADLGTPGGMRARAIVELLYSTGIRNAELRGLKLGDLNFTEGLVNVCCGKGGKDRVVPMGERAAQYLQRYLEEVRPRLRRSRFEDHVFLSRHGKPLSKTRLIGLMENLGKAARLNKPLTCHGLRHSCATHMLRHGADIRHIQELLGHGSLQTTEIYTHVAVTDLKRVHARCHPRERKR